MGLSVSEILFQGCKPIIVEGPSDQIYLSLYKTILVGLGRLSPQTELVFAPTGGTAGIKPVASILGAKTDELPHVIVDSDQNGKTFKQNIIGKNGLYQSLPQLVHEVNDVLSLEDAEIEDMIPTFLIYEAIRKQYRFDDPEIDFEQVHDVSKPIVDQLERFLKSHGHSLGQSWKVELAKQIKSTVMNVKRTHDKVIGDEESLSRFQKLLNSCL
jgi:hypothetical protein